MGRSARGAVEVDFGADEHQLAVQLAIHVARHERRDLEARRIVVLPAGADARAAIVDDYGGVWRAATVGRGVCWELAAVRRIAGAGDICGRRFGRVEGGLHGDGDGVVRHVRGWCEGY